MFDLFTNAHFLRLYFILIEWIAEECPTGETDIQVKGDSSKTATG